MWFHSSGPVLRNLFFQYIGRRTANLKSKIISLWIFQLIFFRKRSVIEADHTVLRYFELSIGLS